jgi:beta-N-acetylhexosaminidase
MAHRTGKHHLTPLLRLTGRWAIALPLLMLAAALAVLATAGSPGSHSLGGSHPTHRAAGVPPQVPARAVLSRRAAHKRTLTLAQLAGQRIIYAYAGLQPPSSLLALIRAGEAAGVILFSNNIASAPQITAVIHELQAASARSPLHAPLLILTDQEGGDVRRLPGAPVLSERQIGMSPNRLPLARSAGVGAAVNLAAAGINVNLAPVLDVFRQPGDFIDEFQRSYSSDPEVAAELGAAFISAQERQGVASTAKHFPGLGAATRDQNTDAAPVVLNLSLSELRHVDELPYQAAITAGVKLVMTSWALYPALDPHLPAGLSPRVIEGELRRRLGFKGITITDAITAAALRRFGSLGQRGVLAARAGADLIICSATNPADNTPTDGVAVLAALKSALASGEFSQPAARQAAAAVLALRRHP